MKGLTRCCRHGARRSRAWSEYRLQPEAKKGLQARRYSGCYGVAGWGLTHCGGDGAPPSREGMWE